MTTENEVFNAFELHKGRKMDASQEYDNGFYWGYQAALNRTTATNNELVRGVLVGFEEHINRIPHGSECNRKGKSYYNWGRYYLNRLNEIYHGMEKQALSNAGTSTPHWEAIMKAITDGIKEARQDFANNSGDFTGTLDDDDIAAFVGSKVLTLLNAGTSSDTMLEDIKKIHALLKGTTISNLEDSEKAISLWLILRDISMITAKYERE